METENKLYFFDEETSAIRNSIKIDEIDENLKKFIEELYKIYLFFKEFYNGVILDLHPILINLKNKSYLENEKIIISLINPEVLTYFYKCFYKYHYFLNDTFYFCRYPYKFNIQHIIIGKVKIYKIFEKLIFFMLDKDNSEYNFDNYFWFEELIYFYSTYYKNSRSYNDDVIPDNIELIFKRYYIIENIGNNNEGYVIHNALLKTFEFCRQLNNKQV